MAHIELVLLGLLVAVAALALLAGVLGPRTRSSLSSKV